MENYGGQPYQFTFDQRQYYNNAQLHHAAQQQQQNASNHTTYNMLAANQGLYVQPDLSVSAHSNQLYPSMLASTSVNNMHAALGFEHFDVFSSNIPLKPHQPPQQHHNLDFELSIPGISLTPLTALQVVEKVKSASTEVTTRFLPCVDFLVSCQQELRSGLAFATKKKQVGRGSYRDNMTPIQFYSKYLDPLPLKFAKKNSNIMPSQHLCTATDEVRKLCAESKKNISFGCESVKNTFLGGMRDGESWGLRRWLSKNGGALHICSDLEHIFQALQAMDNDSDNTRRLASAVRPVASKVHERLTSEVPSAYQEMSSAHPYLPFFHRLESVLKSLANFDPDDDDVIIIDDDEEIQACKEKSQSNNKREITEVLDCEDSQLQKKSKVETQHQTNIDNNLIGNNEWNTSYQLPATDALDFISAYNLQEDELSECEVIYVTNQLPQTQEDDLTSTYEQSPTNINNNNKVKSNYDPGWRCTQCNFMNASSATKCTSCESEDDFDALDPIPVAGVASNNTQSQQEASTCRPGDLLARVLDSMATDYEQGRGFPPEKMHFFQSEMFWNRPANYAHILRLFGSLLREPSSAFLIEPFAKNSPEEVAKSIVNPICFRDIVNALVGNENCPARNNKNLRRGQLKVSLNWNMFYGKDFLEAIDLVILNGLVCYGRDKGTYVRTCLTKLRKTLWDDISSKVRDRANMPTKRSEKSGFVVRKKKIGR